MFLGWRVCRWKVSLMEGCAFVKAILFLCMTISACSFFGFVSACSCLKSPKPIWKGFYAMFCCSDLHLLLGTFYFCFRHVMLCMDFIDWLASQYISWVFLPLCFCRTSHWMASDQSAIEGCGQSTAAFRQKLSMQWKLLPLQLLDTPTADVIIGMSSPSSFAFLIYFSLWGTLKFGQVFAHIQ